MSAVRFIYDGSSGRWQYVIDSGTRGGSSIAMIQVNLLAELRTLTEEERKSLVMVKHAYLDDPTVDLGWAVYYYDRKTTAWIKVAEQESMDVEGGSSVEIPDDFLDQYATKLELANTASAIRSELSTERGRIDVIEDYLRDCDTPLRELGRLIG